MLHLKWNVFIFIFFGYTTLARAIDTSDEFLIEKNRKKYTIKSCVVNTQKYCSDEKNLLGEGAAFQVDSLNQCICNTEFKNASCTNIKAAATKTYKTYEEAVEVCKMVISENMKKVSSLDIIIEPIDLPEGKQQKTFYIAVTCIANTQKYCRQKPIGFAFQMDHANNCTCSQSKNGGRYAACTKMDGTSNPFENEKDARKACLDIMRSNTNRNKHLLPSGRPGAFSGNGPLWSGLSFSPVVTKIGDSEYMLRTCMDNVTDFCIKGKPKKSFRGIFGYQCTCESTFTQAPTCTKLTEPQDVRVYATSWDALNQCSQEYNKLISSANSLKMKHLMIWLVAVVILVVVV